MVPTLYSLIIRAYGILISLVAPFVPKAGKWLAGRRDIWKELETHRHEKRRPVWIHCSSLGEFEQGRPVIEALKKEYPHLPLVLTFFSPSGYEVRKDYTRADWIYYLPLDTPSNADRFIKLINPRLALFVKYDFWFNYLQVLIHHQIPFCFISATFRDNHFLFRKWATPLLAIVRKADRIFVQDDLSYQLLRSRDCPVTVAGDTRIDRVIQLQSDLKQYPFLKKLSRPIIILGSVWPQDLKIVANWINENRARFFFIVAPHDIGTSMMHKLQSMLAGDYLHLSDAESLTGLENGILVNTIGDLAHLYQYGILAYIGGGFGKGIHSILEPVAAGLPVIFGPNYQKFNEANALLATGSALTVSDGEAFARAVEVLRAEPRYLEAKKGIAEFLSHHQGATLKVVQYLARQKNFA
jgi:3-deoxy-D-manno-octulosonic-acid transferase